MAAARTENRISTKRKMRPDFATLLGIAVACAGILGGLILEGGSIRDITQPTAALIVIGGTIGAVMVSTPGATLRSAVVRLHCVLFAAPLNSRALIDEIIGYSATARKLGLVSLEDSAQNASDPFLRKALTLVVDGCDLQEMRRMMELDLDLLESRAHADVKVFEAAGGYAPTIGIIGAVLGLIQVMKNLADTESVGHGIATAFVATVYGVAIANILFLPAANKMKARVREESEMREMMLEGVACIAEGMNPNLIRAKLEAFLPQNQREEEAPGPREARRVA